VCNSSSIWRDLDLQKHYHHSNSYSDYHQGDHDTSQGHVQGQSDNSQGQYQSGRHISSHDLSRSKYGDFTLDPDNYLKVWWTLPDGSKVSGFKLVLSEVKERGPYTCTLDVAVKGQHSLLQTSTFIEIGEINF